MKPSLFKCFLCFSFMIFVMGCGKDKNSSGKGSPVPNYSHLSPSTNEAMTGLQNWYASPVEGQIPQIYQGQTTKEEKRTVKTYSGTDGCENKPLTVFGVNLGSLNYCFQSSSPINTVVNTRIVNVNLPKTSNPKLVAAVNGQGLTLVNITKGQSYFGPEPTYQIEYAKPDGHRITYLIDTGVRSAFNPVIINDSAARTSETVTEIR